MSKSDKVKMHDCKRPESKGKNAVRQLEKQGVSARVSGPSIAPSGRLRTSFVVILTGLAAALLTTLHETAEAADAKAGGGADNFWSQDVWADPKRPFLFYGEPEKDEGKERRKQGQEDAPANRGLEPASLSIFPADGLDRARGGEDLTREAEAEGLNRLTAMTTVTELRSEVQSRLDRAVMNPTPQAIALYLQANAYLMQKAGVFAESWRRSLVNHPRFDWTAVRPAVNAVAAASTSRREGELLRGVKRLAGDYGLVFFGDDSILTRHMLRQVRDFAEENRFETAYVAKAGGETLMPEARPDKGLSALVAGGIEQFPALVLVRRGQKDPAKARLIATGAADAMTLARNTWAAAREMADQDGLQEGIKDGLENGVRGAVGSAFNGV